MSCLAAGGSWDSAARLTPRMPDLYLEQADMSVYGEQGAVRGEHMTRGGGLGRETWRGRRDGRGEAGQSDGPC